MQPSFNIFLHYLNSHIGTVAGISISGNNFFCFHGFSFYISNKYEVNYTLIFNVLRLNLSLSRCYRKLKNWSEPFPPTLPSKFNYPFTYHTPVHCIVFGVGVNYIYAIITIVFCISWCLWFFIHCINFLTSYNSTFALCANKRCALHKHFCVAHKRKSAKRYRQ